MAPLNDGHDDLDRVRKLAVEKFPDGAFASIAKRENTEVEILEDFSYVEKAKDPKKPYGDVTYADPGYQEDGKKRYPLDTEAHVRAAWSYINQGDNAKAYTPEQLKSIKGKIQSAMKKLGATVAAS
jgi:hypothetical protein